MDKYKFSAVLPTQDNNGVSLLGEIEEIKRSIINLTGGVSFVNQEGAWLDGDTLYTDKSQLVYTICDKKQMNTLTEWATLWANYLRQLELLVTVEVISVTFISARIAA